MNKYNPTDPLQVFIEKVNTLVDGFNQLETDRQTHHDFMSYVKDEVFSTYGNRPYLFKSLEEVRKTKLLELDDYVVILKENPNHTIYPEFYVIKEKENDLIGETVPLLNSELVAVRIATNQLTPGDNISIDDDNVISAIDTIYDDTEIRGLIDNKADKQDLISHLVTTDTDGLMSSADKTKLDGIETGAEKNTITSVQGRTGAVTISKSDVGLGNVNNVAITQAQIAKLNELNYTKAMTQEQYDALSTAEKNRTDVWYGIYEE